jgi:hypothetical protein
VYDVSAGASVGAQTYYFNNSAPALTSGAIPLQEWPLSEPSSLNLGAYISDPEGDAITYTVTSLPSGMSHTGGVISGEPSSTGAGSATVTATDAVGDSSTFIFEWSVETVKKSGSAGRAVQYFITIDGERIEIKHPDEAITVIEQYERDKRKHEKIRRVITDSIKLDSTDIPFKVRQRYVQRAIDLDKESNERLRYVPRETKKELKLKDRARFKAKESKAPDLLDKILKKREK